MLSAQGLWNAEVWNTGGTVPTYRSYHSPGGTLNPWETRSSGQILLSSGPQAPQTRQDESLVSPCSGFSSSPISLSPAHYCSSLVSPPKMNSYMQSPVSGSPLWEAHRPRQLVPDVALALGPAGWDFVRRTPLLVASGAKGSSGELQQQKY